MHIFYQTYFIIEYHWIPAAETPVCKSCDHVEHVETIAKKYRDVFFFPIKNNSLTLSETIFRAALQWPAGRQGKVVDTTVPYSCHFRFNTGHP